MVRKNKPIFITYKFKKVSFAVIVLFFSAALIINPADSINAVKESLLVCVNIIIPSLFPFFVCTSLLINLGVANFLGKCLKNIVTPIFNIPGSGALAIILGTLSGYPVGAKCVAELKEKGLCTSIEAERMIAFCANSGPLFILGAVGAVMFKNMQIGLLLYASHILAAITVGIIFRFYKAGKDTKNLPVNRTFTSTSAPMALSDAFVESVKSSVFSILTACGFVVIFSVFVHSFVDGFIKFPFFSALLAGIFEVSEGSIRVAGLSIPIMTKVYLAAFVLGIAGVSVAFQIISIIKKAQISIRPYVIGKILSGGFSVIYVAVLSAIFPLDISVFYGYNGSLPYFGYYPYQGYPPNFEGILKMTGLTFLIGFGSIVVLIAISWITDFLSKK